MSVDMTMPRRTAADPASWRRRAGVRAVVQVALLLARLQPRRLRSLMVRLSAGAEPARHGDAERFHREVVLASQRCAGWRGCLPRSIAVALLCRLGGTWPDWCAGVRSTPPFAAHAWVEADRRMVGEPGTPADYRALIRVGTVGTMGGKAA